MVKNLKDIYQINVYGSDPMIYVAMYYLERKNFNVINNFFFADKKLFNRHLEEEDSRTM